MKKQLTTLGLLSLFALNTPILMYGKKAETTRQQDAEESDSWEVIFDNMHQSMKKMQHKMAQEFDSQMQNMQDGMKELFSVARMPSLQFNSSDDSLIIEISDIETSEVDIKADPERLVIKTPTFSIDVTVSNKLLTAYLTQESKEETTKEGASSHHLSLSQSALSQTIRHAVDLSKAKAQRDEKENRLTLTIPYAVKTPTQSIPVESMNSK